MNTPIEFLILRHVAASNIYLNASALQTEMYYSRFHWRAAWPKFTSVVVTEKTQDPECLFSDSNNNK